MTVDFTKTHQNRVDLVKKTIHQYGLQGEKAQVVAVIDISLSMSGLFLTGKIQKLLERILPLALQFDADGEIDVFLFHWLSFHNAKSFSLANRQGYILKKIVLKHALNSFFLGFATFYAGVINRIRRQYASKKTAMLPTFVLYFTDGDCWDKRSSEKAIVAASEEAIFWKFIGLGGKSKTFAFLQKLDDLEGRKVDNCDFIHIPNLDDMSDEQLYQLLLREFQPWLQQYREIK